jgi:hypothetical protein
VAEGSSVVLSGTGAPPITRPWIQLFHEPDFGSYNWIVDYDDYGRDDFDNFAALEPWSGLPIGTLVHHDKASSLKWFAPVGCSIRETDAGDQEARVTIPVHELRHDGRSIPRGRTPRRYQR